MAVKFYGVVSPENRSKLEPSFLDRRKKMTDYRSPMGNSRRPLPVAPHGEVLNPEQKFVMEKALNELASRRESRESVIEAGLAELRHRRKNK